MSERDNETFDLDDEFLSSPPEDGTDYDRLLDRVDKRVRNQGKRGKAAWSRVERKDLRARVDRVMTNAEIAQVDRVLIGSLKRHLRDLDERREHVANMIAKSSARATSAARTARSSAR